MTAKAEILQAIRANCVDCSGGSRREVAECPCQACPLWPYRMGRDPAPARRGFAANAPCSRGVLSAAGVNYRP